MRQLGIRVNKPRWICRQKGLTSAKHHRQCPCRPKDRARCHTPHAADPGSVRWWWLVLYSYHQISCHHKMVNCLLLSWPGIRSHHLVNCRKHYPVHNNNRASRKRAMRKMRQMLQERITRVILDMHPGPLATRDFLIHHPRHSSLLSVTS